MNGTHMLLIAALVLAAVAVACTASRRTPEAAVGGEDSAPAGPVADDRAPGSAGDEGVGVAEGGDPAAVTASVNAFADALFAQVAGALEGNVLVSPVSVAGALQMTLAGAAGQTRDELASALRVSDPSPGFHAGAGALQRLLAADGAATVDIANRIWLEQTWAPRVRAPFRDVVGSAYSGGFELVDFATAYERARADINGWVSEQTREKIPELVPMGALDSLTRFVLTNAVYFDADWMEPFDPDQTVDDVFHAPAGDRTAPLMHRRARMAYAESGGAQLVALPYRERAWEMVVLLPASADGTDASDVVATMTSAAEAMQPVEVDLTFPKFRFRWNGSLVPALRALGVEQAFGPQADFSELADLEGTAGLYVSDVLHEAFVEVDEEGTEAAAATAVIVATRAVAVQPRVVEMRVDRPFFFALRHTDSGAFLFVGRVEDPTAD